MPSGSEFQADTKYIRGEILGGGGIGGVDQVSIRNIQAAKRLNFQLLNHWGILS
ncbi:hypothetical protein KAU87_01645 [Candidatus Bathyarchaeota archaeon]|nr:hypothetical protein [Candidatus Bathyarchaeota archaeon]